MSTESPSRSASARTFTTVTAIRAMQPGRLKWRHGGRYNRDPRQEARLTSASDVQRLERRLLSAIRRGDRRLRADRGRGPHPRRGLGRQGLLGASQPASPDPAAGAGPVRAGRPERRPGLPGIPGRSDRGSPRPGGVHLRDAERPDQPDRQGEDPARRDVLLAVRAAPPRGALQVRRRARLQQDRPRPPRGRLHRDPAAEPLLQRPDQGHACPAPGAQRSPHGHPAPRLRLGGGDRRVRRGPAGVPGRLLRVPGLQGPHAPAPPA